MTKTLLLWRPVLTIVLASAAYAVASQELTASAAIRMKAEMQKTQSPLLDILSTLEKEYKVSFHYNHNLIANLYVEDVLPKKKSTLEEKLESVLSPLNLKFSKVDDDIYLIHRNERQKRKGRTSINLTENVEALPVTLFSSASPAAIPREIIAVKQEFVVTGNVSSTEGEVIPGANILVKGTTNGTVTDADGNFRLSVPSRESTLVVSFIGYVAREISVNGQSVINVSLVADVQTLNEVVVVGYGTQKKRDVTGAVAQISSDKIKDVPAVSVDQFIQGRAAGVQVTQSNGQPGGSISIRIRGNSSLRANNEPLYVIDGVPVDANNNFTSPATNFGSQGNALATLNPNDVASIEILKDASASAIYGSRGANGVVLITTKRGKAGQGNLTLDSYYGVSEIGNEYDMLSTEQFLDFVDKSYANANAVGISNVPPDVYADDSNWYFPGTDWQDELYRAAPMQSYNLGLTGGNDKSQHAISAGYFNQQGTIRGTDLKRYSFRVNLDTKVIERLKIGNSLSVTYTDDNQRPTEQSWGLVMDALRMQPGIPVRSADGDFGGHIGAGANNLAINPVGNAEQWMYNNRRLRVLGNIYGELEIAKFLSFRSSVGTDYVTANISHFQSGFAWGEQTRPSRGTNDVRTSVNWVTENYLSFNKAFGKHNLNAVAGTSAQYVKQDNAYTARENFASNDIPYVGAGSEQGQVGISGADHFSFLSYYARVNYSFRDKYLLTATYRADGSSKFGPANKWGGFPSFSAGWIVSEEPFMKRVSLIDLLKMKVGYGRVGNAEIGLYSYRSNLARGSYILEGGTQVNSVYPNNIPNNAVAWETSEQFNVGLEAGVLQSRIKLETDFYIKNTVDNLLYREFPGTIGNFGIPPENIGEITNRGFELMIGTVNTTGALGWNTDINFSLNRNEFVSSGVPTTLELISDHWINRVGHPVGMFYGHIFDGIFQSQEEVNAHAFQNAGTRPGDVRFKDINQDGVINADDRVIMGNAYPDFIYGMTNTFTYKNFDLSLFIQGVQGNDVYNQTRQNVESFSGLGNQTTAYLESWTEQNRSTTTPKAIQGDPNGNARRSTRWLEDGSFLRVKNLTVGYSLPESVIDRIGLSRARIYITGQNLLTFTEYSGYDPEVGGLNQGLYAGRDFGTYPIARTIIGGINLQF